MFSVERFQAPISDSKSSSIEDILADSTLRAKRKYEEEMMHTIVQGPRGETVEERQARKRQAKEEKKARKELMRAQALSQTSSAADSDQGTVKVDGMKADTNNAADTVEKQPAETCEGVTGAEDDHKEGLNEDDSMIGGDRDGDEANLDDLSKDEISEAQPDTSDESVYVAPSPPMGVIEAVDAWGLDSDLASAVIEDGIDEFFPVQTAVIPLLLAHSATHPFARPRDMCVSAPTGSGKTLAYALPVVQSLSRGGRASRWSHRRLRALIILPSRELVTQVLRVFCRLCRKKDWIRVGSASGQVDLKTEQSMLVSDCGESLLDALVCTPGRLLDHLQYTSGFTLQHLRFLVMDEADRLLGNAYDHWVRALVSSVSAEKDHSNFLRLRGEEKGRAHLPVHIQRLLFSATLTDNPRKLSLSGIHNPLVIRSTPALQSPTIDKTSGYILPRKLSEFLCVCDTSKRPLLLLAMLMQAFGLSGAPTSGDISGIANCCSSPSDVVLIFSSSVESTHRLCRLLQVFNNQLIVGDRRDGKVDPGALVFGGEVREMSSAVRSSDRASAMEYARAGYTCSHPVKVIVASDQLARGIDLSSIRLVINYDPPAHPRTYVHRVGRTARANRDGYSVTMLKIGRIGEFKKIRSSIDDGFDRMKKAKVSPEAVEFVTDMYQSSLKGLRDVIDLESKGALNAGEY